tara:strand:+ start:402 stop:656 length:255 start_codon:yes stop_codon:yes gene_type:complete
MDSTFWMQVKGVALRSIACRLMTDWPELLGARVAPENPACGFPKLLIIEIISMVLEKGEKWFRGHPTNDLYMAGVCSRNGQRWW